MAVVDPTPFKGAAGNSFTAAKFRRVAQSHLVDQEGVLTEQDLLVRADSPASMRTRVATGRAWIAGDAVARQGCYLFELDSETFSPYCGAAHATLPRIDLIVARIYDSASDGGSAGSDDDVLEIVAGTPAASPVPPALPGGAIPLAELTINAGATTISSIRDVRPLAAFLAPAANLAPNSAFGNWSRGTTSPPDGWGIAGAGATIAQDTTNLDGGHRFSAAVTAPLNITTELFCRLGPLSGTDPFTVALRGRTLTMTARVKASAANRVRIGIYDGTAWNYSAYHTGGGSFETLSVSCKVADAALNTLSAEFRIDSGASITAYIAKVAIVLGTAPVAWAPRAPVIDELLTGRVYEREVFVSRSGASGTVITGHSHPWHTPMAGMPTVTLSGQAYTLCSGATATDVSIYGAHVYATSTGSGVVYFTATADAAV